MPRRAGDINPWDELYRRRHGMGPFYGAAVVAVFGVLARGLQWWELGILAGAFVLAGIARVHRRARVTWRRLFAYAVLLGIVGWLFTLHSLVPEPVSWTTAGTLLVAGTLLAAIPWWSSEIRLTQVRMEQQVRDWPRLAQRIGRPGLQMANVVRTSIGAKGKFWWAAGLYEVREILGMTSRIEAALKAPAGTLQLVADGRSTNSLLWEIVEDDPHALPQEWPVPTNVGRATDPLVLGPMTNGELARVQRYARGKGVRNMAIGGAPESGKSGLINLVVASNVCSEDVVTVGLDFKGGAELGPWRDALAWTTAKVDQAQAFLHGLAGPDGLLDERGAILAETGHRVWDTKIHGPVLDIVVDEARELLGNAPQRVLDHFISVGNKGRALGVRFTYATQYPTLEAIGSSQVRQATRQRFVFRMEDETGEGYLVNIRVRAEKIPAERPGTCYFQDGEIINSRPTRIYWLSDETVRAVVEARRGRTAELDERSEAALVRLFPEWAERERWVDPDEAEAIERERGNGNAGNDDGKDGTVSENEDEPDLDLAAAIARKRENLSTDERERLDRDREAALDADGDRPGTAEEARTAMLRALALAGDAGMAPKDLQRAAGRGSSWFYPEANKLAEQGLMQRTTRAVWIMPAPRRAEYLPIVR
jgi:S-DNA-T family DNA segregation ATPase FtsK/SpoIIIE